MQKFMNTGLATVAAAALAIGILGAPQAAKAETCALVKSGNAFSINATDNTFNPTTNSTGATSGTNLACGDGTVVTGTNATAVGGSATAAQDGTAIGQGSSVTGAGSVALGQAAPMAVSPTLYRLVLLAASAALSTLQLEPMAPMRSTSTSLMLSRAPPTSH